MSRTEGLLFELFPILKQNNHPKILIRHLDRKKNVGRGLVILQLPLTLEKDTRTFSFQSNEPSRRFIRPTLQ